MNYITMLAKFGSASAHPGGFAATKAQLAAYPLPPRSRVLEVGCGVGQTACYLAGQGHDVTAIDCHSGMVEKTRKRADHYRLPIACSLTDVHRLPYADGMFDVVIFESVMNFARAEVALSECLRVLKSGGVLYGRELMVDERMPPEKVQELRDFFEMPQILTHQAWRALIAKLQPASQELLEYKPFNLSLNAPEEEDEAELVDEGAFDDVALWRTALRHDELLFDNTPYLFTGLFRVTK